MTTSFNFLAPEEFAKLAQLEKIDYVRRAGIALENLKGPRRYFRAPERRSRTRVSNLGDQKK